MADELLNCATGDAVPATVKNSSCFRVDQDGIVKIDSEEGTGRVMQVYAGQWYPASCISKCYQNYKEGTATTAKVYNSEGSLVTGIIIRP